MSSKQFSKLSKSSKSTEYGTPKDLFEKLNNIFKFELDPCTTPDNPLGTKYYFTKEINGLGYKWNVNTFINPPFGKGVREWIEKMDKESKKYWLYQFVMLLPARTDTKWFQDLICQKYNGNVVYFIKGRLKFVNPVLNGKSEPHIIGSMLWIRNAIYEHKQQLSKNIPGVMVEL